MLVSTQVPLAGPLLLALAIGIGVSNSPLLTPTVSASAGPAKLLLRSGVGLLGFRISWTDLEQIGMVGMFIVVATVCVTYAATVALGRMLRVSESLTVLIAAGFSICGAAAIAAVSERVRVEQRDVGFAVALVTMFGTVMLFAVPQMAGTLGMTDDQAAIWVGASVHEVAQVVAAATLVAPTAVAIAMAVKLGRVALLAPVLSVITNARDDAQAVPRVPWFVIGFLLAIVASTAGLVPNALDGLLVSCGTLALAAGMFGLGLGIRLLDMWPLPVRGLLLGGASTVVAATTPLMIMLVT